MFFSTSGLCQRELVEAHGSHWLVCLMLDATTEERAAGDLRFALAVKCDAEGRVTLPSEGAQLIRFVPAFIRQGREAQARIKAREADNA